MLFLLNQNQKQLRRNGNNLVVSISNNLSRRANSNSMRPFIYRKIKIKIALEMDSSIQKVNFKELDAKYILVEHLSDKFMKVNF